MALYKAYMAADITYVKVFEANSLEEVQEMLENDEGDDWEMHDESNAEIIAPLIVVFSSPNFSARDKIRSLAYSAVVETVYFPLEFLALIIAL